MVSPVASLQLQDYQVAAESSAVLDDAMARLGTLPADQADVGRARENLADRVTTSPADAVNSNILYIDVEDAAASATADAVADALVAWDADRAETSLRGLVTTLTQSVEAIEEQLMAVQPAGSGGAVEEVTALRQASAERRDQLSRAVALQGNARPALEIIERAAVPLEPAAPQPLRLAALAATVVGLIGASLALLRHRAQSPPDQGSSDDVTRALPGGIAALNPLLGVGVGVGVGTLAAIVLAIADRSALQGSAGVSEAQSMERHRLVTRSDFDGLICAVLLKELDVIGDITFVHPRDMQHGLVPVTANDITTNVPYVPGVHLAFDHHESEMTRVGGRAPNHIIDPRAPSAARVVYSYYGGRDRFPTIPEEMMEAVDKADSAQYSKEDILDPSGWVLLSYLMDARTGLGRFRDFRISNYQLMMQLIDYCKDHTVEEILELPDIRERVHLYRAHEQSFRDQLLRCSTAHDNLVVLDLRDEETIYAGNRFVIYALFPGCNISIHVLWGLRRQNTVFAVGRSILDRSSRTDIGSLMLAYGGGGHAAAGTCQIPNDDADWVLDQLIARVTADG